MSSEISARVIDQRCRNRIVDALDLLSGGSDGVRAVGGSSYFNFFYDWLDLEGRPHPNTAMTAREIEALEQLIPLIDQACDQSVAFETDEQLMASGLPDRIAPQARQVLDMFNARGRFNEDVEESEPSMPPI